jgi:hypothetical protein
MCGGGGGVMVLQRELGWRLECVRMLSSSALGGLDGLSA